MSRIVMRSKNRTKVIDFIRYAADSEGMAFVLSGNSRGYTASTAPGRNYDPQVVAAVKRNFTEEYLDPGTSA